MSNFFLRLLTLRILEAINNQKLALFKLWSEALESGMCDIIKIPLKRRDATIIGKGNKPLNIKTAVEQPILKLRLPNFR